MSPIVCETKKGNMGPQDIIHSTFEMSHRAVTSPFVERFVLMPPKVAGAVFWHAKRMVSDTTELVFPTKTQREFARELAGEHELEKAERALKEIEIGEETDISTIKFAGRAALAEIAIEAEALEVVPWRVTDQIVEMAIEAEVDPEFEPLLDDEKQNKLKRVFRRHNTVRDMFRYRENRL